MCYPCEIKTSLHYTRAPKKVLRKQGSNDCQHSKLPIFNILSSHTKNVKECGRILDPIDPSPSLWTLFSVLYSSLEKINFK